MKRCITSIICLLLLTLVLSIQVSADSPVRVLLGGRELFASPRSVEMGGEAYIPQSMLESFGASFESTNSTETVRITAAGGQSGEVTGKTINGSLMLPASKVAETIDAVLEPDMSANTVRFYAKVKSVELADGELRINSTLPAASTVTEWKDARKLMVDVHGSKLSTEAKEVYVGSSDVQRVRLGQMSDDTVRVVVDLNRRVGYKRTSNPIASQIVIKLGTGIVTPAPSQAPAVTAPTGSLTGISVEPMHDELLVVKLATSGKVGSQTSLQSDPLSLNIDLLNAELGMSQDNIAVDHPLVKSIQIENNPDGFRIRVILNTTRFVAYDVDVADGQISVSIKMPKGAGGKMSDKTIVIDPGHGGKQTGTRKGGYLEKSINLQIAKRLQRLLLDQGVNAVLTRDGDHSLSSDLKTDLQARPNLAAKLGADMFISIHCNSGNASVRGTETFYHQNAQSGRALAHAIHSRIIAATGMKDRKAKPDPGQGFVVLRYSTVPAVLIETGFLSNSSDRACLVSSEFQEKLVRGIVDGIKAYVEGAQ